MQDSRYQYYFNMCLDEIQREAPCTPESIERIVEGICIFANIKENAIKQRLKIQLENSINIEIGDSHHIINPNVRRWLTAERKANITWGFWNQYKKILKSKGRTKVEIQSTDAETDAILTVLTDPQADDNYQTKGLVIGDVQSGKTGNFTGVICKAADAGYKVIIVIAGTQDTLRNQTQIRLDTDFVGTSSHVDVNEELRTRGIQKATLPHIHLYTSSSSDFDEKKNPPNASDITFLVIKKNVHVLDRVLQYFKNHKITGPALILDDEADNASPNGNKPDIDPAQTNKKIREILALFPQHSYVGYTATPYANIFINPYTTQDFEDADEAMLSNDLYPKDFIFVLSTPNSYISAKKMFRDDEDDEPAPYEDCIVITDSEKTFLDDLKNERFNTINLPDSLKRALITFILAKAIRNFRGQERQHCSMLINVSPRRTAHSYLYSAVKKELTRIVETIQGHIGIKSAAQQHPVIRKIKEVWDEQYAGKLPDGWKWEDICKYLQKSKSIDKLPDNVIVVNSDNKGSLDYNAHKEEGLTAVVIGGNSLSRGLTLEGLTVSYFLRTSKQYDTLMQMGRWFGYRPNYGDICRIFLPSILRNHFAAIAYATDELKEYVKQYQDTNSTPMEFGSRVRNSASGLLITARNKMRSAKVINEWLSFDGCRKETHHISNDKQIIQENLNTFADFILQLETNQPRYTKENEVKDIIWEKVSPLQIKAFITKCKGMRCHQDPMEDFVFHKALETYLDELHSAGSTFDVALIRLKSPKPWSQNYTIPNTNITIQLPTRNPEINKANIDYIVFNNNRFFSKGDEKGKLTTSDLLELKKQLGTNQLEEYHYRMAKERNPMLMLAFAYIPEAWSVSEMENIPREHLTKLVCGYGFSFPMSVNNIKKKTRVKWVCNAVDQYLALHPSYNIVDYYEDEEYDD